MREFQLWQGFKVVPRAYQRERVSFAANTLSVRPQACVNFVIKGYCNNIDAITDKRVAYVFTWKIYLKKYHTENCAFEWLLPRITSIST